MDFATGAILRQGPAELHALDAERRQYLSLNVILVLATRCTFNDPAKKKIAEVGVGVTLARIEVERLAHHVADDIFGRYRRAGPQRRGDLARQTDWIERLIAVPTAGVM